MSVDCFDNARAVIFKAKFRRLALSPSNENPALRAFNKFKDTNQKKLIAPPTSRTAGRKGRSNEMDKDKKFLKMIQREFSENQRIHTDMEDFESSSHDQKQIEKIDNSISKHSQVKIGTLKNHI